MPGLFGSEYFFEFTFQVLVSFFFSLKIPQFVVRYRLINDKFLDGDYSFRMVFCIDIRLARVHWMERLENQDGQNDQQLFHPIQEIKVR